MNINHVAIIPDGNGRWATKNNVSKAEGHRFGAENALDITNIAVKLGIKHLTLWAFSAENWKRDEKQIEDLIEIMIFYLTNKIDSLNKNNIRLKIIGNLSKFKPELQNSIIEAEKATQNNTGLNLYLALSYGGKEEIVAACQKIISKNTKPEDVSEELIKSNLYIPDMPEVDLVIRTGGDKRLSNFLIWQIAYSELYFSDILWPDFSESEFLEALEDFYKRKRNFGYSREQITGTNRRD